MCVVSMIYDHYTIPTNPWRYDPPMQVPKWPEKTEKQMIEEILDLLKKAEDYDKKTGQPNCEKDGFDDWKKSVEKRLKELEKK